MAYIKKIKIPNTTEPYDIYDSSAVHSVNNKTGTAITLSASDVGARPDTWTPSKSDIGLGNVDNVKQYSASNPPPYPVTSVNGQTGTVTLDIPTGFEMQVGTTSNNANLWFDVS